MEPTSTPSTMSTDIRISPGFCLLVGWFAAINGWQLLAAVLGAAAIHEAGHYAALRLLGTRILGLRIGLLGAVLETDSTALSYGGELAAVLAGPVANLLSAVVLTRWDWKWRQGPLGSGSI